MYIDYTEYKGLGGTLEESTFASLVWEAQVKLDYYTFNKLTRDDTVSEKVKRCLVKIITLLNTHNEYINVVTNINNPVVASQSNDGVSVSYGGYLGNTTPSDIKELSIQLDKDIKDTIKQYLALETNQAGEVLLYRGVYR